MARKKKRGVGGAKRRWGRGKSWADSALQCAGYKSERAAYKAYAGSDAGYPDAVPTSEAREFMRWVFAKAVRNCGE